MAYDLGKINLTPFGKVVSTAGTEGMANIPALENKALLALERSKYWEDKKKEMADLNADTALSMYQPQETSWGDVAMGVVGSAGKAGLFDGFGSGLSNSSSIWEGKDLDPGMTYWDTDMPIPSSGGNSWLDAFGWGR